MSRVDDLIAELCPDGVEFVPLANVGDWYGGGTPSKSRPEFWSGGTIPWVSPKDMGPAIVGKTEDYITEAAVRNSATRLVPPTSVAMVVRSSILDRVLPTALVPVAVALNQDMKAVVPRGDILPSYLAHLLRSRGDAILRAARKTGGSVASIETTRLFEFRVPVPPLEVQREIVRILDTFTALEAELEAELEARRRQYDHYSMRLISAIPGRRAHLRELGRWLGGVTPSKSDPRFWDGGEIPWLASMDVSNQSSTEIRGRVTRAALAETSLRLVPAPSVAVVMRSNILRRRLPVGLVAIPTTINQDIRALIPGAEVDADFVYQAIRARSEDIRATCVRTDGSMAAIDSQSFFEYEIPLPSLSEQRQIALELRGFDALVNDLSVGLPAELAARRKQYEYYRDKLLTFPEAS